MTRRFVAFFNVCLNGWVTNREAGDLRRHRVTIMLTVGVASAASVNAHEFLWGCNFKSIFITLYESIEDWKQCSETKVSFLFYSRNTAHISSNTFRCTPSGPVDDKVSIGSGNGLLPSGCRSMVHTVLMWMLISNLNFENFKAKWCLNESPN